MVHPEPYATVAVAGKVGDGHGAGRVHIAGLGVAHNLAAVGVAEGLGLDVGGGAGGPVATEGGRVHRG